MFFYRPSTKDEAFTPKACDIYQKAKGKMRDKPTAAVHPNIKILRLLRWVCLMCMNNKLCKLKKSLA